MVMAAEALSFVAGLERNSGSKLWAARRKKADFAPSVKFDKRGLGGSSRSATAPQGRPRGASAARAAAEAAMASSDSRRVVKVQALPVTPEAFAPFGTVVLPDEDGAEYGPKDAKLDLSKGIPRVYIMRLKDRKLGFKNITHHASVTQCLGAAGNGTWYLGVCPASIAEPPASEGEAPQGLVKSKAGHWFRPPKVEDVVVFKIQGPCILKLHPGTWHAGPLFTDPYMDFYNLELSDTNIVDHTTHYFDEEDNVEFEFDA